MSLSQSVHDFFAGNGVDDSIFNFLVASCGFFGPKRIDSLLIF